MGGAMYLGVWIGKEANENGILILGESHYGETETTRGVIEFYLSENHKGSRDAWMRFFDRISKSFGYYEMSEEFWDKVFYGNYIEMPCGVGDNKADEKYELTYCSVEDLRNASMDSNLIKIKISLIRQKLISPK